MSRPADDGALQRPYADLADHLKALRRAARLSQRGLAERAHVSRGAVQRLESGTAPPTTSVLDACLLACRAGGPERTDAFHLLKRGRTAQRGKLPGLKAYGLRLDFISTKRELGLALAAAYERAGAPSLSDTRLMSGRKPLPRTTAWRIVNGKGLPATTEQLVTFLTACGVSHATQSKYIHAYRHVTAQRGTPRLPPRAHRPPPPSLAHSPRPARGGTRVDATPLAEALTVFANSVPRIDFEALAPALTELADRLGSLGRLVNRDAHRNGAAMPALAVALTQFAERSRVVTDNTFTTGGDDTGIDLITHTGDGTVHLHQVKSHRGRPGPPPALPGAPVPPTRPSWP
ncbi:helix-turn-helix domain-containing protein [Streptomyces filamentosus]|uniref:helix-turn-helix domain-containing protein n=1 Tax=Streptomyces filamentosus TaxID=67294 RepID=UPI0033E8B45F